MLLHNFLEESRGKYPDKVALVDHSGRYTYSQINEYASNLASFLIGGGLVKGDRVVCFLDNGMPSVVSIFGALKAGCAFLPVNPTTKINKLNYILKDSGARAMVMSSKHLAWAKDLTRDSDLPLEIALVADDSPGSSSYGDLPVFEKVIEGENPGTLDESEVGPGIIDLDLAALVYTSGSTGFPKGVTLTHRNMVSASTSITTYLENRREDVILNVLPLSFDYGLYQVLMAFQFGGRLVLERSFNYPFQIVKQLQEEEITGFPGVPTIFTMLGKMEKIREMEFPHLRYITNTGAAMPVPVLNSIQALFPGARFYSMYGLTECKRVSYLPPEELQRRPESVGKGMPNEEVYIVREDGSIAEPGETGELVVRGSNVMAGYWNDQEATDKVLKRGIYPWEKVLHTGDLFRSDEEGFLYFIGRVDDIIKSRGEKVSPREVENVLFSMPGIVEAAVIGVPDEILGSAIEAHVVSNSGYDLTELQVVRYCSEHLETFMVPKFVVFHDQLPKNQSGKIDKLALADLRKA